MAADLTQQCRRAFDLISRQGGMVMLTRGGDQGDVFTLVKGAMAGEIVGPAGAVHRLIAGRYLEPVGDGLIAGDSQTWRVAT